MVTRTPGWLLIKEKCLKTLKQNMPSPSEGRWLGGTAPPGVQTLAAPWKAYKRGVDCVSHLKVLCVCKRETEKRKERESERGRETSVLVCCYMVNGRTACVLCVQHLFCLYCIFWKSALHFFYKKQSEQPMFILLIFFYASCILCMYLKKENFRLFICLW